MILCFSYSALFFVTIVYEASIVTENYFSYNLNILAYIPEVWKAEFSCQTIWKYFKCKSYTFWMPGDAVRKLHATIVLVINVPDNL